MKLLPFSLFTLVPICFATAAPVFLSPKTASSEYDSPVAVSAAQSTASLTANKKPTPTPTPKVWTVTSAKDSGSGTLRNAIAGASSGDTIVFKLNCPSVISLLSTLTITNNLNITGPGPDKLTVMRSTAAGTGCFGVFENRSGTVLLAGMTIRNGCAHDTTGTNDNVGGGIYNHKQGDLTVSNCVVIYNTAPSTQQATRTAFGFGAGIFTDVRTHLLVVDSLIGGNSADTGGGALGSLDGATMSLQRCAIIGNYAGYQSGAFNFQGANADVVNCTFASNGVPGDAFGSAIVNLAFDFQGPPTLTLTACTVAGNLGSTNEGAIVIAAFNNGLGMTNRLRSTIVAQNAGPNFTAYGTYTSITLGNNLDSDGTSGFVNGVNGDIVGTLASPIDPKLGPLQDNGGPTPTMSLLAGSPALGTGACSDANGAPLLVDQRSFPRPATTGCDIGAYENQPLIVQCPADLTVVAQSAAGANVCYSAAVLDLCPHDCPTYTPASGSLFPFGTTPVVAVASDVCGNTNQCTFNVTVIGTRQAKSNALAQAIALRAIATYSKDQQALDTVIADLAGSLAPAYWVNDIHVNPSTGGAVFLYEQDAADELQGLLKNKKSHIPDCAVSDLIDEIVAADRLLAVVALADAGNPSKGIKELNKGDDFADSGKPKQAIQRYLNAWAIAVGP